MRERQANISHTELAEATPRAEKLAGVLATLEQGLDAILTDEAFAAYLRTMARLHNYSFANTLLILAQKPDATLVAGFNRWKSLDRHVKRGEKGIAILVPYKRRVEDEETGEEEVVVTGFGVGHVWDVAQTEGKPLPPRPAVSEDTSSSGIARALNLRLSRWLIDEGLRLESKEFPGNAAGFYHPAKRQIVVRRSVVHDEDGTEHELVDPLNVQKTKTLVHEAAHYVANHRGAIPREDAETVAESSAFVVLSHFGIDSAGYSFPYVATWATDKAVFRRNLGEIQRVATTLITAIGGEAPVGEEAL